MQDDSSVKLCECGCGQPAPIATITSKAKGWVAGQPKRFVHRHAKRKVVGPGPNPSGICMCGCGQPTPIATHSSSRKGMVKGEPVRFIHGHNARVASEEARRKFREAGAANRTPETYAKIGAALRGRPRSAEARARISEGRRNGKKPVWTPDGLASFRQKMVGENHPNWKNGKAVNHGGYVVLTRAGHPMADSRGRVLEHRLVMSEHLGRNLLPTEVVHHINGDRADNRIENLQLFSSNAEHLRLHGEQGDLGHQRATRCA